MKCFYDHNKARLLSCFNHHNYLILMPSPSLIPSFAPLPNLAVSTYSYSIEVCYIQGVALELFALEISTLPSPLSCLLSAYSYSSLPQSSSTPPPAYYSTTFEIDVLLALFFSSFSPDLIFFQFEMNSINEKDFEFFLLITHHFLFLIFRVRHLLVFSTLNVLSVKIQLAVLFVFSHRCTWTNLVIQISLFSLNSISSTTSYCIFYSMTR